MAKGDQDKLEEFTKQHVGFDGAAITRREWEVSHAEASHSSHCTGLNLKNQDWLFR